MYNTNNQRISWIIVKGEFIVNNTKKLVLSALFMALGIVLPFFTGQIPQFGNMLLPMHIPVLLCGFICGAPYGFMVGFTVPLLRSIMFGRPVMFPTAMGMVVELAMYGLVAGAMYATFHNKKFGIYISLITAMTSGRILWGAASFFFYKVLGNVFTWEFFMAEAFFNAIPGIIIQLTLIPALIFLLKKAHLLDN